MSFGSEARQRPRRVAIVGLGLMGASLALALRQARPEWEVVGIDTDPATVRKAIDRNVVAEASGDLGAMAGSDLIVLALPVARMAGVMVGLAPLAGGAVITDLASTKVAVVELAGKAGLDLIGGHPMCGREQSGIDAADPDLYAGAPWVLTRDHPAVVELVVAVGARPLVLGADIHDRLVAGVSHAAFLVSVGYVLALAGSPDWPRMATLAASGYRDMSRLAGGDPDLYAGIVSTNRENIGEALDSVIASLTRLRRHLETDDSRLVELFEEARSARDRWRRERDAGGG